MNRTILTVSLPLLVVAVCFASLSAQQPPPSLKNFVAVGDSLSAGYQNFSLNEKGQNHSYPSFLARQLGTYLFLPLITEPGIPPELVLIDPGPPPEVEESPGPQGTRVFPTVIPQNLAVPGQTTLDALIKKPALPLDSLEDIILGVPSLVIPELGIPPLSQLEMAYALTPTFTVLWLGSNEVLDAVLEADPSFITPIEVFMQAYPTAIGTIQATGSALLVANVPDVTIMAFLTSAEELAAMVGAPLPIIGPALGVEEGDFVTGFGLELVPQILGGVIPGPLPGNVVLTASEALEIRAAVATMNGFIAQLSQMMNFPVVDVHTAFNEVDENGLIVGGRLLTTRFLGGFFSLDGVHPTNTGCAFTANLFIEKMNEIYFFPPGFAPQPVDLEEVANNDPLVPELSPQSEDLKAAMAISGDDWLRMIEVLSPSRYEMEISDAFESEPGSRPVTRSAICRTPFRVIPGPAFTQQVPKNLTRPESRRERGRGRD